MTLHEKLSRLLVLQGLDLDIERVRGQLKEHEWSRLPEELRAEADAAGRAVEELKQKVTEMQKRIRWCERESTSLAVERKNLEKRLYSGEITNLKEIEQAQKRIDQHKERQNTLEDEALRLMDEVEGLQGQVEARTAVWEEKQRAFQTEDRAFREKSAALRARLASLREERERVAGLVDPGLKQQYDYLRPKKGGIAIAAVRGGVCGACRVTLSIVLANRVKKGDELYRCENCGRLLCWGEGG